MRVSILIPAYNAEAWLADTIRSALAQTWPRKEIVVVDDGSTDRTLEVARSFASQDVLIVAHENQGAAATRNKAFSLCQGAYIQWLDADDLLSANKVARQIEALSRRASTRTLLTSGWGYFTYRRRRADFGSTPFWCDLSLPEWLMRKMGQNLHMQTATRLVSRELSEAAGPWNARLLSDDDGEYVCRVLLASDGARFVPGVGVFYRRAGSGRLSHIGWSRKKMEAMFHSIRLHIGYLRSLEDSERTRAACVTYMQTSLINFYPEMPALVMEAEQLAADLGGRLETPRLSWKYDWIRRLFDWNAAKRAQVELRELTSSLLRWWDRILFRLERFLHIDHPPQPFD